MNEPTTKRHLTAASVSGDLVFSTNGDEIGMIHELLIDPGLGVIASAVVSFHRLAGFEDERFIIPWRALRPSPEQHRFVFDINKADVISAIASYWRKLFDLDELEWTTNGQECFAFRSNRH